MHKQLLIIIIVGLVFFGLGYAFGFIVENKTDAFQDGWDAARQRLIKNGIFSAEIGDMKIREGIGLVEEVNGNKISLKLNSIDPLSDPGLKNRVIKVDDSIEIYKKLGDKDSGQYQRELEEYIKKIEILRQGASEEMIDELRLPLNYDVESADFEDIKVGQHILIVAKEDIRNLEQFKVMRITIYSEPQF